MALNRTLRGFFRDAKFIWEMGLGAGLALLFALAAVNLAWIATNVARNILVILILALCYGLYLIRHFLPLSYGTVEIVIGLFAIFGAMGRSPQVVDDPGTATLLLVQLAAGMYHHTGLRQFRAFGTFRRG
jgi:hypothetical protein